MQVIASERPNVGRPSLWPIMRALIVGSIFLVGASFLAYTVFGTGLLSAFTPTGRASSTQLAIGAMIWAFGLIAPAAFAILGIVRVGSALGSMSDRRVQPTPAYSARMALGADHAVATRVPLPDGSRIIVNRQTPNREIWVAARSGGFHYRWRDGAWRDTRGEREFFAALAEIIDAQAGERVEFG